MFAPGQLVLCVDDKIPGHRARGFACPTKGIVYTVRDVIPQRDGLFLCEIRNPSYRFIEGFLEPGFHVRHFRPLDDSRIAIFRQALRTAPVSEKEPV